MWGNKTNNILIVAKCDQSPLPPVTLTKSKKYLNNLLFVSVLFTKVLVGASYFYYETQMNNESTKEPKSKKIKTALNVTKHKRYF